MQHPIQGAPWRRTGAFGAMFGLVLSLTLSLVLSLTLAGCGKTPESWMLDNVEGHLPDLSFSLTGDNGKPLKAADLKGKVAVVYFGYTHCPDICPQTMANLTQALAKLGNDANDVRLVFISVDPTRDTPQALHDYVDAFDARHAIGLTGSPSDIETLAKRYRVAYQADAPNSGGSYEVSHSSGIYIFDRDGKARLLANGTDSIDALAHDLRQLVQHG
jgi:protein SCO1